MHTCTFMSILIQISMKSTAQVLKNLFVFLEVSHKNNIAGQ